MACKFHVTPGTLNAAPEERYWATIIELGDCAQVMNSGVCASQKMYVLHLSAMSKFYFMARRVRKFVMPALCSSHVLFFCGLMNAELFYSKWNSYSRRDWLNSTSTYSMVFQLHYSPGMWKIHIQISSGRERNWTQVSCTTWRFYPMSCRYHLILGCVFETGLGWAPNSNARVMAMDPN